MSAAPFQVKEITSTGVFPIFFSPSNVSGVFSITIKKGTKFTFQTAIDISGNLVDDPIYNNFTVSAQDTFEHVCKLVLIIQEIAQDDTIQLEYKLF